MNKKEKSFCQYVCMGKSLEESAVLAGFPERTKCYELIKNKDVVNEITTVLKAKRQIMKELSVVGYERLAFGNISDCISLVTQENMPIEKIKDMDLFMISEIKKPKDGAMEIKFFDRLKAMEKLETYFDSQKETVPFYSALEKGAMALGCKDE